MSTHNIQFHNILKKYIIFVFLSYWKNFVGTEKRVRIIHGKRAIRVRAIEVIPYLPFIQQLLYTSTRTKWICSNSKRQELMSAYLGLIRPCDPKSMIADRKCQRKKYQITSNAVYHVFYFICTWNRS